MSYSFKTFFANESGAITVDWVVLAAAIVGVSIGAIGSVLSGSNALATDVNNSLSSASVVSLGELGGGGAASPLDGYQLLFAWQNDDVLAYWDSEVFPTMSDNDLVSQYEQYVQIAANGTMPSFMDFSYAMLTEMTKRGLATDAHMAQFTDASAVYT